MYVLGLWSGYDRFGAGCRVSLFSLKVLVAGILYVVMLFFVVG